MTKVTIITDTAPIKEERYKVGDIFLHDSELYILCKMLGALGRVSLINLQGGNRYTHRYIVMDKSYITKEELEKITGGAAFTKVSSVSIEYKL